jgi:hypothetical protein
MADRRKNELHGVPVAITNGLPAYALRVGSNADIDKLFAVGDYPVFVKYKDLKRAPEDGDVAHVSRTIRRGNRSLVETTIRRVRIRNGKIQLRTESRNPSCKRNVADGPDVKVSLEGRCIGFYRSLTDPAV